MEPVRVMVTGAGSAVGQGIVKSLRISKLSVLIVGADIQWMSAALFRTDEAVLIPKVEEDGALERLLDVLRDRRIQVVMIGSEFDLVFFSKHRDTIRQETGALVIASALAAVELADDKWLTMEFFRKHGIPHPESYLPRNAQEAEGKANEWGYPLLLKSRTGTSSRNVHILSTREDLLYWQARTPKPLLQKLAGMPGPTLDSEYTCSIFKCSDGKILGPFTARRTIRSGHSRVVEVSRVESLHRVLFAIGKELDVCGSLNIQLMAGPSGPMPFELNARFSGTTAVRAYFGFNEPEMALRSFFWGESLPQPVIRKGIAIRYDEEVFLEGADAEGLEKRRPVGEVLPWF